MNYFKNISIVIFILFLLFPCLGSGQTGNQSSNNNDSIKIIVKTDTVFINQSLTKKSDQTDTSKKIIEVGSPPIEDIISFSKIFWSLVVLIIGFFIIRIISKTLDLIAEKSTGYRITIKGFVPIIRIFGWLVIIYLIIAGIFRPPLPTIITVAASLGIAVGFAAQDIFKNIFGGIMILFDRPFQVGDKIQIGDYYGEVIKIGLRSTRIVTPDDSTVSIPNGEVMSKSVSNTNYGEPNCQVVAEIFLPITVDTEKVRQIAVEAAQVSKYIFLNKPVVVLFFNEVKERRSYLKMRLKAYVMDIRYEFQFKSEMTEIVMRELIKEKIIAPGDLF
jgi:small-conductance mechanosensitive channel